MTNNNTLRKDETASQPTPEEHDTLFVASDDDQPEQENPAEPSGDVTPSWFARSYRDRKVDDLASYYTLQRQSPMPPPPPVEAGPRDSYEIYRRRVAERVAQAQAQSNMMRGQDRPGPRPTLPVDQIEAEHHAWRKTSAFQERGDMRRHRTALSGRSMAAVALVAVLTGGGVGYAVSHGQEINTLATRTSASIAALFASGKVIAAGDDPASETVIRKKTVSTASLSVNDVAGSVNGPIPLLLQAEPADASQPIALKVMGLPDQAYLTAGVEISKGDWLLKPAEIPNVKLVVPSSESPTIGLSVAAIETNTGELAAPVKEMTVALETPLTQVQPANAPPEAAGSQKIPDPLAVPPPNPEAQGMVEKGDSLLKTGDLAMARQFYLKAAELGLAAGSFGVARTYDPAIYAALGVNGLQPDPAKAAEWYRKAAAAGVVDAEKALTKLGQAAQP
jgi:hypothetical protein